MEFLYRKISQAKNMQKIKLKNKSRPARIAKQGGFIALISSIIISAVLLDFAVTIGESSFHSRINNLDTEFKKVSSYLAEGCVNSALLKIAQNYNYEPAVDGEIISISTDQNDVAENCTIKSVAYDNENISSHTKTATIDVSANYNNAFSNIEVIANVSGSNMTITSYNDTIN